MYPRRAIGTTQQFGGVRVVEDLLFGRVPGDGAAELGGEVGHDAGGAGDVALLDVGDRFAALLDLREEIFHVHANRRRDMFLEVLFGFVLRKFFEFVSDILVHGRAAAARNEIVTHDAGFERAFVAIDRGAPRIFRVGRVAPGAVGPDDFDVPEIEGGGLSVGDVRLGFFLDENAAGGIDAGGRAEIEHPADHIEHVNAHVADDSVAVFHEGAPAAGMRDAIEGTHGGGAGPHFPIEIFGRGGVGRVGIVAHVVIAVGLDVSDFAELAFADDLVARFDE